jgi:hypothetical protein
MENINQHAILRLLTGCSFEETSPDQGWVEAKRLVIPNGSVQVPDLEFFFGVGLEFTAFSKLPISAGVYLTDLQIATHNNTDWSLVSLMIDFDWEDLEDPNMLDLARYFTRLFRVEFPAYLPFDFLKEFTVHLCSISFSSEGSGLNLSFTGNWIHLATYELDLNISHSTKQYGFDVRLEGKEITFDLLLNEEWPGGHRLDRLLPGIMAHEAGELNLKSLSVQSWNGTIEQYSLELGWGGSVGLHELFPDLEALQYSPGIGNLSVNIEGSGGKPLVQVAGDLIIEGLNLRLSTDSFETFRAELMHPVELEQLLAALPTMEAGDFMSLGISNFMVNEAAFVTDRSAENITLELGVSDLLTLNLPAPFGEIALKYVELNLARLHQGATKMVSGSIAGKVEAEVAGHKFDISCIRLFSKTTDTQSPDQKSGSWKMYGAGLEEFSIPGVDFSLGETRLEMEEEEGKVSGSIETLFEIAGVDLTMKAAYNEGGLEFSGSTGPGQAIHIDLLIEDLVTAFKTDAEVPAIISDLTFSDLAVSFSTKTKDFSFSGKSRLTIDGQEVDIIATIDIKHQQDDYFTKHFGGHITIGERQFDLSLDKDPDSSSFLAAYHKEPGEKTSIKHLISGMSSTVADVVPEGLDITLNSALFVYRSENDESKYLFGIDMGNGIDLSNLPMVGSKFPPGQAVKLNCQVLYSSKPFEEDQLTALNLLLPEGVGKLPEKNGEEGGLKKGIDLAANMQLGAEYIHFSLPLEIKKQGDASQKKPIDITPGAAEEKHPKARDGKWFEVQKAFGPVHFERVGINYADQKLWVLLDVSLTAAGLTLSLEGLSVSSPLTKFDPDFDLQGIGLDYKGGDGAMEIGGVFSRIKSTKKGESDRYDGLVVFKTEALSISAIGSYAKVNGHPSLFVYLALDYPLGGPPFFFVKGLAGGFGYNRALKIPPVEELAAFPFIAAARKPTRSNPSKDVSSMSDVKAGLDEQLEQLDEYVYPEIGEQWLAIGVHFSSFEIVDGFVLLTVAFGHRFEINLLGTGSYAYPPGSSDTGTPLTFIDVVLKASYLPDEGTLEAKALLTSKSFLYDPKCHLTGGMAFKTWFKDTKDGGKKDDFVLTIGGYHPKFKVPAHYPTVPRLGFNWQYSSELSVKGGMYFAMNGQVLMAGGFLNAVYESGALRAWFKASADFLIRFKPFHYDAGISVEIGASVTIHFFGTHHLTVTLGADLHIWGPDFAGRARLHIWIASFSISFGAGKNAPKPITWSEFITSFLPQPSEELKPKDTQDYPGIVSLGVQDGLIKTKKLSKKDLEELDIYEDIDTDISVVNPKELSIVTNSIIPITNQAEYVLVNHTASPHATVRPSIKDSELPQTVIGIAPMKQEKITAKHTVNINRYGEELSSQRVNEEFDFIPIMKDVPAGLWGKWHDNPNDALANKGAMIANTLAGLEIRARLPLLPDKSAIIDRKRFSYETMLIESAYSWEKFATLELVQEGKNENQGKQPIHLPSLVETTPQKNRDELLRQFGFDPDVDTTLSEKQGPLRVAIANSKDKEEIKRQQVQKRIKQQVEKRIKDGLLEQPLLVNFN